MATSIWLRTSFEIRCLRTGFAKNIADFERQANLLVRTVGEQDYGLLGSSEPIPALVGLREESRSWTVYMVIEHLRRHTDFLLKAMRSLVVADELEAPTPAFRYWQPEDVGNDCVDQFQDSAWQYVGFANNLLESGRYRQATGTIRHPHYGLLDLKRLSVYGCHHLRIHRRQIQKTIAMIGIV